MNLLAIATDSRQRAAPVALAPLEDRRRQKLEIQMERPNGLEY